MEPVIQRTALTMNGNQVSLNWTRTLGSRVVDSYQIVAQ